MIAGLVAFGNRVRVGPPLSASAVFRTLLALLAVASDGTVWGVGLNYEASMGLPRGHVLLVTKFNAPRVTTSTNGMALAPAQLHRERGTGEQRHLEHDEDEDDDDERGVARGAGDLVRALGDRPVGELRRDP